MVRGCGIFYFLTGIVYKINHKLKQLKSDLIQLTLILVSNGDLSAQDFISKEEVKYANLAFGLEEGSGCSNQRQKPASLGLSERKLGGRMRLRRSDIAEQCTSHVLEQQKS
jgi:hypothetical protein